MRCTKTDGGWILNGQKRFTTSAHFADWYWVAGRTDPDAPKHKGITLFLVPMNADGITITAMDTIGDGERTNEVFLDNVFVDDDHVVGEVNKGWYYISEALDFERFTLFTISAYVKKYEALRGYVRQAKRDGKDLKRDPHVRKTVASLDGYIEDEHGNFDWAAPDEEVHAFVNDLERGIGTYLYGRRMYETMVFWETVPFENQPPVIREYAEIWRAADKIVFSTTLE